MTKLKKIQLPPVSYVFYKELVRYFPPIRNTDINENTSIRKLDRKAGQQDVIEFIKNFVTDNQDIEVKMSFKDRLRFVLNL